MSFEITTAFVEGFRNNIYMLAQQKNARLWGKSRNESQNSEVENFERIGETEAEDIVDRHGDTPFMNSQHSRRQVTLQDADWGDLIDKLDRVKMLINPNDAYVKTAVAALNRKKDDIFIAAALGVARGGKKGADVIALPDTQKLVATDGAIATNLNVLTLTLVQAKFDDADVEEDTPRMFAWTGSQKQAMLNEDKATSSDFASVKALVRGEINSFMGFEFIRSQRLPVTAAITAYVPATGELGGGSNLAAGARRCFAWLEDGMISSHGEDLIARISERDDKRYSTQIYAAHSVGAVRMEEEKVIEVICNEA